MSYIQELEFVHITEVSLNNHKMNTNHFGLLLFVLHLIWINRKGSLERKYETKVVLLMVSYFTSPSTNRSTRETNSLDLQMCSFYR